MATTKGDLVAEILAVADNKTFAWCSKTLQAYMNVLIYALFLKSPSQCKEGFY